MATCTIVVTQNTDLSVQAKSTDAASFVIYVPNEAQQLRRLMNGLKDVITSVLTLNDNPGS